MLNFADFFDMSDFWLLLGAQRKRPFSRVDFTWRSESDVRFFQSVDALRRRQLATLEGRVYTIYTLEAAGEKGRFCDQERWFDTF